MQADPCHLSRIRAKSYPPPSQRFATSSLEQNQGATRPSALILPAAFKFCFWPALPVLLRLKTFHWKVFPAFGRSATKGPKILALPNRSRESSLPLPWPSNSIFHPLDEKFWLCQTVVESLPCHCRGLQILFFIHWMKNFGFAKPNLKWCGRPDLNRDGFTADRF